METLVNSLHCFPVAFCSFRKDNSAAFSERIYTEANQSFEPFGSFEEIKLIWSFEWIGSFQAVGSLALIGSFSLMAT